MQPYPVTGNTTAASEYQASFILKVYNWMTMGLAITALISLGIEVGLPGLKMIMVSNPMIFFVLLGLELVIVWVLSAVINKIPAFVAVLIFMAYAALNGVTLSIIFMVYTSASIATTFFVTAAMFACTSIFGFITKIDLSRFGGILMMALIGLIIASIANIFVASSGLEWIISYAGVIIFVGLTAYDTQKIKNMSTGIDSSSEEGGRASIMGALALYLDFINLFLFLLRILGRRR
ncbi:MAG: Bax inhibitor-1/YccA family protein [Ignavibacteriae bacterium]|nr:MAG: Bax inhibitor-1/YccA family protein [Ignavibacteriota bacterium]